MDAVSMPAELKSGLDGINSFRIQATRQRDYSYQGNTVQATTTWDVEQIGPVQFGTTTTPLDQTWDLYVDYSGGGRWYSRKQGDAEWRDSGPSEEYLGSGQKRWQCPPASVREEPAAPGMRRFQITYASAAPGAVDTMAVQLDVDAGDLRPARVVARWTETYSDKGTEIVQQLTRTTIYSGYNEPVRLPADRPANR